MTFNLLTINNIPSNVDWIFDFLKTFISVLVTGWIGWICYNKQQRNIRIENTISIYILFCSIIKSYMSMAYAIYNNSQECITELTNYTNKMLEIQRLAKCFWNNKIIPPILNIENSNIYIKERIFEIQKDLVIKKAFIKQIGHIEVKNYEEKASYITVWGDITFQELYRELLDKTIRVNETLSFLDKTIDDITEKRTVRVESVVVCDLTNKDYEAHINYQIQQFLFLYNMYKELKDASEEVIFYGDLLFNHLNHFNECFYKKFQNIITKMGFDFPKIKTTKLYKIEDFEYYQTHKKEYARFNKLPPLKTLNLNFIEKIFLKMQKLINN